MDRAGAPLLGDATHTMFAVARFWEKSSRGIALLSMHGGCLWNSFVMAGAVSAFIDILQQTLPNLLACFEALGATAAPGMKDQLLSGLCRGVPATNFSEHVLSACPAGLAVMRGRGLGWTDLGDPARVLSRFPLENLESLP